MLQLRKHVPEQVHRNCFWSRHQISWPSQHLQL